MPPGGFGLAARAFSMPEGEPRAVVLEDRGVRITALLVDHAQVTGAVGYRVDYGGRSLVLYDRDRCIDACVVRNSS